MVKGTSVGKRKTAFIRRLGQRRDEAPVEQQSKSAQIKTPNAPLFPGDGPSQAIGSTGGVRMHQLRGAPTGFAQAFLNVAGPNAVKDLIASFTKDPVVLIAGDQLTGKSTAARAVASALDGKASGTGKLVRKEAESRGLSIEEMSKDLADEPDFDAKIDLRAAGVIAQGDAAAFESRLAGHLGEFLKELGRENVLSVYLACGPKERALRYVARECGDDARTRIEPQLKVDPDASLKDCLLALGGIDDPAAQEVAGKFDGIASRDQNDKGRLMALYGVDYQDRSVFDVVIDTTRMTPEQVKEAILEATATVAN